MLEETLCHELLEASRTVPLQQLNATISACSAASGSSRSGAEVTAIFGTLLQSIVGKADQRLPSVRIRNGRLEAVMIISWNRRFRSRYSLRRAGTSHASIRWWSEASSFSSSGVISAAAWRAAIGSRTARLA